jgi:predicted RNase H-like nuclease (RuvC/YqgF family)
MSICKDLRKAKSRAENAENRVKKLESANDRLKKILREVPPGSPKMILKVPQSCGKSENISFGRVTQCPWECEIVDGIKKEVGSRNARISDLETRLENRRADAERLQEENHALRFEVKLNERGCRNSVKMSIENTEEFQQKINHLDKENAALNEENNSLMQSCTERSAEITRLKSLGNPGWNVPPPVGINLTHGSVSINDEIVKANVELSKEIAALNEKIAFLKNLDSVSDGVIDKLREEVAALEKMKVEQTTGFVETIKALHKENEALEAENEALKEEREHFISRSKMRESQFLELETHVENMQPDIATAAARKEAAALREERDNLYKQVQDIRRLALK